MQDAVIVLTVCVDCDTAPALTSGQDKLEDILVLHLEGGKDFFISFSQPLTLIAICIFLYVSIEADPLGMARAVC